MSSSPSTRELCPAIEGERWRWRAVPVLVVHDVCGAAAARLEAFLHCRPNRCAIRVSPTRGLPQFEKRIETVAALDRFWQSLARDRREEATR